ncbi:MAG: hypothetical protein JSS30_01055 [Verrucomicrobia bacterium]|nr:hypothetical protein [Verrucomicrobiota bacterium]
MNTHRRIFIVSLGLSLSILVGTIYLLNRSPPGFSLDKICSTLEPSRRWAIGKLSEAEREEICKIFCQDFNYLGSGEECIAFLSADGKYVLKFFRTRNLTPKNWLKLIPLPGLEQYKFKKIEKRMQRHQELFSSYKMAYEDLREETGLVYIHLNKTKNLHSKVRLFDRMRRCHKINLDDYEFIVQKKAQLVSDRITAQMQKGDRDGALESLSILLKHVVKQCKKGYIDRDVEINPNYGFVGDQVIHFDVGRVVRDEAAQNPSYYQREILRIGEKLEEWLKVQYPELLPGLEELIDNMTDPSFS